MPIRKIDRSEIIKHNVTQIEVKEEDLFVISGWEVGQTIMAQIDGDPVELIGTTKEPLTVEELKSAGVNIEESIIAGVLGKLVNGEPVYYVGDTAYDTEYDGTPDHLLGTNFKDDRLNIEQRTRIAQSTITQNVNPNNFLKTDGAPSLESNDFEEDVF